MDYRILENINDKDTLDDWLNSDSGYPDPETKSDQACWWIQNELEYAIGCAQSYFDHNTGTKVVAENRIVASPVEIPKGTKKTAAEMIALGWDLNNYVE